MPTRPVLIAYVTLFVLLVLLVVFGGGIDYRTRPLTEFTRDLSGGLVHDARYDRASGFLAWSVGDERRRASATPADVGALRSEGASITEARVGRPRILEGAGMSFRSAIKPEKIVSRASTAFSNASPSVSP